MELASSSAQRRRTFLIAAAVACAACVPVGAPAAALATAGRTSAGGAGATHQARGPSATAAVRISSVSCVPVSHCSTNPHEVSVHGTLKLSGGGLRAGMTVVFPRAPGAHITRTSPGSHLRQTSSGLLVTVPRKGHSGRIMVLIDNVRHTGSVGPITIVSHPLHPPVTRVPQPPVAGGPAPTGTGFEGQGMWIWYVSASEHGSVPAIIERAHAAGVTTVFIKSSDGSSNYWSQFSPQLVSELHAAGLKVCAWQYVYGTNPVGEAALGARAVSYGADCLAIDAEAEYEGRYASAQTYITELRARIGPSFPLALASFPYVNFHESEPYSVFLGPGGAQFNEPQMYWKAIGQSVDTVYANTYIGNRIYGRPIFPLGQTYENVSSSDLLRFREEAVDYGATGTSYWDWQETPSALWSTLAAPLAPLTSVTPNTEVPELHSGSKGDQVLWLQEHLAAAIPGQEVTGNFGSQTKANLISFQTAHGIPASGIADPPTWAALLALAPVPVDWTGAGPAA